MYFVYLYVNLNDNYFFVLKVVLYICTIKLEEYLVGFITLYFEYLGSRLEF
jgi:hypothetical protein